ncbi:MAG: spore germination protein [Clostridia bacterium]|nr:spore germination protein [Clostridia bacterium]
MMRNKWYYITLSALVVALFAVGYWGFQQQKDKNEILLQRENSLQQAFYELTSDLQQLEVTISKAMVASTPMQRREVLANMWRQANTAQQNLAKLPLSKEPLVNTQKYLNQLADYSFTLLKGERKSDSESKQIAGLYKRARLLTDQLMKFEASLADREYPWTKMAAKEERNFSSATRKLPTNTFSEIEDQMQQFPQLVYDGPFADENLLKKPRQLEGPEITEGQAIAVAKKFLNLQGQPVRYKVIDREKQIKEMADDLQNPDSRERLRRQLKNGGPPLETYLINVIPHNREVGNQSYISITKKGGRVMWVVNTRNIDGRYFSLQDAQAKAVKFMDSIGMENFKPTGVLRALNQAVVSFAAIKDNVIIYPDLVKVKVALDNGEIIGYEARNYIFANHDREIPETKLSLEEAQKALEPNFKVKTSRKAIIPLSTGKEVMTYEFYGSINGLNYLVYVNADTGQEEKILRVVKNEDGVLTI